MQIAMQGAGGQARFSPHSRMLFIIDIIQAKDWSAFLVITLEFLSQQNKNSTFFEESP